MEHERCVEDGRHRRTVQRTLETTAAAHNVADIALNPLGLPQAAAPLLALIAAPTIGLLPPRLRDDLGLSWSPGRDRILRLAAGASRTIVPLLPRRLRHVCSAREAARRMASSQRFGWLAQAAAGSAGSVPRMPSR
jgi:uncharacterized protein (DUF2236 family)